MMAAKLLGVPAFLAIVLTLVAAPLVIALYRKRITFWMRSGPNTAAPSTAADVTSSSEMPGGVSTVRAHAKAHDAESLVTQARSATVRIALAYAAGGLTHALLLSGVFTITHFQSISSTALITAFFVFAIPTVATVLYLSTASKVIWVLAIGGFLLTPYAMLGPLAGSLALLMFQTQVLLPAVLFVLFSMRLWRGVAPLMLVVMAFAMFCWVGGAELARLFTRDFGPALWTGRIGGFLFGACIGYLALQGLRKLNEARRLSDQELFLDTWWLLHTIVQAIVYVFTFGIAFIAVLLLFPAYFVVKRIAFRALAVRDTHRAPVRLLLLRVFGYDTRAERLFDYLDRRWRFVGRVELIAGRDLATRNIGPLEFADFLAARLHRRFIRTLDDLRVRMASRDDLPYPDGRFRAEHFYCNDDTWQAAMRTLAADCDIVLMDLRGFAKSNAGVRYELDYLARTAPHKPVVLLADDQTDVAELNDLVHVPQQSPNSAPMPGNWHIARVGKANELGSAVLMRLLARALVQPGAAIVVNGQSGTTASRAPA